jgi:hypothetical protein
MLRRLSVIAASVAMLALSALPAYAATQSSTHKLSFPSHSGISAWGNYKKTSKGIYVNACAKDTGSAFAVGAVVVATNSSGSHSRNLGAVAFGHGTTQMPVRDHPLLRAPEDLPHHLQQPRVRLVQERLQEDLLTRAVGKPDRCRGGRGTGSRRQAA